jgi:hypothetical protein
MKATARPSPEVADKVEVTISGEVGGQLLGMDSGRVVQRRHLSNGEAIQLTLGRNDAMILSSMIEQLAYALSDEDDDRIVRPARAVKTVNLPEENP